VNPIEILTTDDLARLRRSDPDLVSAVVRQISIKGILLLADEIESLETGLTLEEYRSRSREMKAITCKTCDGTGKITPTLRSKGVLHASAAEHCVTAQYYDLEGVLRPRSRIKRGLRLTFAYGHTAHEYIQRTLHSVSSKNWSLDWQLRTHWSDEMKTIENVIMEADKSIRAMDIEFKDEVEVNLPDVLIEKGHADGVLTYTLQVVLDGEVIPVRVRILLEIKSIGESSFTSLKKEKDEHITQAGGIYAVALDTPFVSYLYQSKGFEGDMLEFVRMFDSHIMESWMARKFDKIEHALLTGQPPFPDMASEYNCADCRYGYPGGCRFRKLPRQADAGRRLKTRR
jgi:hypothetical protein